MLTYGPVLLFLASRTLVKSCFVLQAWFSTKRHLKALNFRYGANSSCKTWQRDLRWFGKCPQCRIVERYDAYIIQVLFCKLTILGHAADFAGTHITDGTIVAEGGVAAATVLPPDRDGAPPAEPPPRPFYKKRWFIISQIILIPISIAMLFILLYPVLRAIAQLVVNKSTLDVQVATISNPQNNTLVLVLFWLGRILTHTTLNS